MTTKKCRSCGTWTTFAGDCILCRHKRSPVGPAPAASGKIVYVIHPELRKFLDGAAARWSTTAQEHFLLKDYVFQADEIPEAEEGTSQEDIAVDEEDSFSWGDEGSADPPPEPPESAECYWGN
jgi:hypothetical protein